MALASLPLATALTKPNSRVGGVTIGAQSYSFRDRSLDEAIKAMLAIGLSECELWDGHVQPRGREAQKKWREDPPLAGLQAVAKKFKNAGIALYAYSYAFRDNLSDAEIENGFRMARALGVKIITTSANVSVTPRVARFAEKYKILVGMHGHSSIGDPNEFATPESFEKAMKESKYIGVNLDIGHFLAGGFDPVAFTEKWASRMTVVHLKDRKKNLGPNMPFGDGDTPIREVLQLMKRKKYKFPANIEYEYKGADTVAEVRKSYEYCRKALA